MALINLNQRKIIDSEAIVNNLPDLQRDFDCSGNGPDVDARNE
jgi:hypothetical protein